MKKFVDRYLYQAMSAMALGLFSSLIIGLILSQCAKLSFLSFLEPFSAVASASSPVVGSAIGVAIAYGLKAKPLVVYRCVLLVLLVIMSVDRSGLMSQVASVARSGCW